MDAIGSTYEESKSEGILAVWVNMLYMAACYSQTWSYESAAFTCSGPRTSGISGNRGSTQKPVNRQGGGNGPLCGLMVLMAR